MIPQEQSLGGTTISLQSLLISANTLLVLVAGYFIRDFVRDVQKLTDAFHKLERKVAVVVNVINRELNAAISEEE